MSTATIPYGSELVRKRWLLQGLIQKAPTSFWAAYQGKSFESIVYQETNTNASDGHTVVFQFDGYLVSGPVKGKEVAFGKGEQKKLFSDKITVERYRFPVDNGDAFDGVNVGDLSITQHQDSRSKLGDKYIKFKDQAIFDVGQQSPTHIIASNTFTFDDFLDVENIIKTGQGYSTGDKRMPLAPFKLQDGRPVWLMVVDSAIKNKLLKTSGAQNVFQEADLRGNQNRLIKGVIGKVGNFLVVEADTFFGTQRVDAILDNDGYAAMNNIEELQWKGLRQYKGDNFTPAAWTGQSGFEAIILGAGAFQVGYGKMPDYKFQASMDFGIKSESVLEVWTNTKATIYNAENGDYSIKEANISTGIIGLDIAI